MLSQQEFKELRADHQEPSDPTDSFFNLLGNVMDDIDETLAALQATVEMYSGQSSPHNRRLYAVADRYAEKLEQRLDLVDQFTSELAALENVFITHELKEAS